MNMVIDSRRRPSAGTDDSEVTMLTINDRMLPPVGADLVRNLLYTIGFMRVLGEHEGAAVVDRQGAGKVYDRADSRADETIAYFDEWMVWGAHSDLAAVSAERVRKIHAAFGKRYSMSPETFVHTIAFFTLQLEILLGVIGGPPFNDAERAAQLDHWRRIGKLLGVVGIPETWDGMRVAVRRYEGDSQWFGYTPAAKRTSDALIGQFNHRWLPMRLHWAGRLTLLSLHEPHVLVALGQKQPPQSVAWIVRQSLRRALWLFERLPAPKPVARSVYHGA